MQDQPPGSPVAAPPRPRRAAVRLGLGLGILAALAPIGRYLVWKEAAVRYGDLPQLALIGLTVGVGLLLLLRAGLLATFSVRRPLPPLRVGLALAMILLGALGLLIDFQLFAHWD